MTQVHSKKIVLFYLIIYLIYLIFLTLSPFRFRPPQLHHFPWPIGPSRFETFDFIANIFLFLPFGFLIAPMLKTRPHLHWKAVLISAAASLTIESMQIITVGRFPAFGDIFTNAMGGGIGFFICEKIKKQDILFAGEQKLHPNIHYIFMGILIIYSGFLLYLPAFPGKISSGWNADIKILISNNPEKTNPWKGELLSLAIYDKALSYDQIKARYQNREAQDATGHHDPLALYSFQDQQIGVETESKIYEQIRRTDQMTVEAWIKPQRQFNAGGRFFSLVQGDHSLFHIDQEIDEIAMGIHFSRIKILHLHSEVMDEATGSESTDQPAYLVGVYYPGTINLYYNGKTILERSVTNNFFLLANWLNLDRISFGGRGLLGLLVFWPFGLFLSVALKQFSTNWLFYTLYGFLFVGIILLMQVERPFFTLQTAPIPFLALFLGVISGERSKKYRI